MAQHKQLFPELDSYDLQEVYAPVGPERKTVKAVQITLHGKNLVMRALEPVVRIGDVQARYPMIQPDERRIVGFLTDLPKERSPITLEYGGRAVAWMREPFTLQKLKRRL
jgi:hypothetical protein